MTFDSSLLSGYKNLYLWSCPPGDEQDYIFNRKPPTQRKSADNELNNWYKKMLDMGVENNIVKDYQKSLEASKELNWINLENIPYFDGLGFYILK